MPTVPRILSSTNIRFADQSAGLEKFFRLEDLHICRANGVEDHQIVWRRGDFVVVIAFAPGGIVFIKEHKIATNEALWGLPSGGIEKDENPIVAALRELNEETGYGARFSSVRLIGPLYNSPDKSTERHFVVVFGETEKVGEPSPEATESILEVRIMPLEEAYAHLRIALHLGALAAIEHART